MCRGQSSSKEDEMEREELIRKKIEGIKNNSGENRSDEEIRKQAEEEIDKGIKVD